MREITDNQRKYILAFLSSDMELCHGERIKVYKELFRDQIESTNDLRFAEASKLIDKMENEPEQVRDKVADILGWQSLFD